MYNVTKTLQGSFRGECRIQDDTLAKTFLILSEAIDWVIAQAKAWNNSTIKRSDICFMREETKQVLVLKTVTYKELTGA